MDGDPTPALTGRRRTRPTSPGCRNPQQPEPGRAPLISAKPAVQSNRATSRYLKGGFFTLNRTPKLIQRMRITLLPPTLHPHGNCRLRRISATEFNGRPVKSDVRKRKSKKVRHAVYLSVVTKGAA